MNLQSVVLFSRLGTLQDLHKLFRQMDLLNCKIKVSQTIWKCFSNDNPEICSIQVHFFNYAHNTQTLSHLYVSPYESASHTQLRLPLNFQLCLSGNNFANVLHSTVLIYDLKHIIDPFIYIFCFGVYWWNQLRLGSLELKHANLFISLHKSSWKKISSLAI